jgi:Lipocalin-like domain
LVGGSIPAKGQTVTAGGHPLHGVWELVSLEDFQPDGTIVYSWGKAVRGTITYTPGGRVFVQLLGDPNPKFSAGNVFSPSGRDLLRAASDDEIRKAYSGYYAYFGTYEIDESKRVVTHHVTSSLRPHEIGLTYERPFELMEERLVLRYPVPGDLGGTNTRVIVWSRSESLRR